MSDGLFILLSPFRVPVNRKTFCPMEPSFVTSNEKETFCVYRPIIDCGTQLLPDGVVSLLARLLTLDIVQNTDDSHFGYLLFTLIQEKDERWFVPVNRKTFCPMEPSFVTSNEKETFCVYRPIIDCGTQVRKLFGFCVYFTSC
ncbi:hypothetical protein WUBG_17179 [Wuchereria bancrofti]|uniref:Uncharacterized protein n=1 Tax=Wuchereria bancrofti TaxID=6293 RepID=J9E962_WUCBA|nr:hypothetical protein WUBG_17179 [Wuchereria bancrofti]